MDGNSFNNSQDDTVPTIDCYDVQQSSDSSSPNASIFYNDDFENDPYFNSFSCGPPSKKQLTSEKRVEQLLANCHIDAVSTLDIFCQKYKLPPPIYVDSRIENANRNDRPTYFYSVKLVPDEYRCEEGFTNKKASKQIAARNVLSKLLPSHPLFIGINNEDDLLNALLTLKRSNKRYPVIDYPVADYDIDTDAEETLVLNPADDMFSKIGRLMMKKFNDIMSDANYSAQENLPKIFAGFCLRDSVDDSLKVVCVTAGNQCIAGDKLKFDGTVLNDCHAEILARRCLVRYLYARLTSQMQRGDDGLFEKTENEKFRLKEQYSFHLYVSTTPCGDGRIFPPGDLAQQQDENFVHSPSFMDPGKNGMLRCKMECGDGSSQMPVNVEVQTVDGINSGERLYTMSCSDKILKWNVLGIQGTLLTTFIEPIYISSLTVGSLFHRGHLSRAICCRLTDLTDLPTPFQLNHPSLGQKSQSSIQLNQPKPICFDWLDVGGCELEQLDGGTGRTLRNQKSRLCKSDMYALYKLLKQRITQSSNENNLVEDEIYYDAKLKNLIYQRAKEIFVKTLKNRNYGVWLNKPTAEKTF